MLRLATTVFVIYGSVFACRPASKVSSKVQDQETATAEMRGSEAKRNIRRYLECKGRRCEDRFPGGAEAVAERTSDFKEVWDTLAHSESTLSQAEYAERLKLRKRARR
jgi:hypothetical protein